MADRFNRSNFYKKEVIDGIKESDLLTNTFNEFKFKRPLTFFTISTRDKTRPDLLSYRLYNKVNFWWIVLKVNNIEDPFNDLEEGDVIKVPDILDVEDFYNLNKRKNR